MMYNTALFDLDGTLLRMTNEDFFAIMLASYQRMFADIMPVDNIREVFFKVIGEVINHKSERTNEQVFYEGFARYCGQENIGEFRRRLLNYYRNDYGELRAATHQNTEMIAAVRLLREKGFTLVMATNPVFPDEGVPQRVSWAGLSLDEFDYVTSFEKDRFAKPHVEFFYDILNKLGKDVSECLYVGNDRFEDMAATQTGITTWLIDGYVRTRPDTNYDHNYRGRPKAFLQFVRELPDVR